jgi:hypothetical protein
MTAGKHIANTPIPSSQANWGTSGEKAIVAFGVFLNNASM